MSTTIQIADAVVSTLNANFSPQTFTAERKVLPVDEVRNVDGIAVTVVPYSDDLNRIARDLFADDYIVHVAVQKQISTPANVDSEVATMASLTKQIAVYMRTASLSGISVAKPVAAKIEPIYDGDHLAKFGVFTSVIRLTYKE